MMGKISSEEPNHEAVFASSDLPTDPTSPDAQTPEIASPLRIAQQPLLLFMDQMLLSLWKSHREEFSAQVRLYSNSNS